LREYFRGKYPREEKGKKGLDARRHRRESGRNRTRIEVN